MGTSELKRKRQGRWFLGVGLAGLLAAALLVGCGGDDEGDPDPGAAATSTPVATESVDADGGNGSTDGGQVGEEVSTAALESLNSFRFAFRMSGSGGAFAGLESAGSSGDGVYELEGAFVSPDRVQISATLGDLDFATTIIGDQQWSVVGGQTVGPTPAEPVDIRDALIILDVWDESAIAGTEGAFDCDGTESINGVDARKCSLSADTQEALAADMSNFFGGDVTGLTTYDVWLSEAGIPVRLVMEVKGSDDSGEFTNRIEMDITDVNGDISIEEP